MRKVWFIASEDGTKRKLKLDYNSRALKELRKHQGAREQSHIWDIWVESVNMVAFSGMKIAK